MRLIRPNKVMEPTKTLPCPKIMRGQQELTPEQEAYMRTFTQERLSSMLSTSAIDEKEAEEHLRQAYQLAGFEAPLRIRWFDSPLAFIIAHLGGDNLRASLWANLGANLGDNLRANLGANLRANLWANLWDNLRANLWANLGAAIYPSIQSYYDENWLAFYRFFHEVFEENNLIHLALFNEMVSGYRLGSKEAWLVRKPIRLERDEQGRLHSETGMCMQYRDGYGFSAWHGVRCAEKIILHPEQIAKEDWLNESNLELRRVIQERLGNDRFVEVVGGKVIDTGKRGQLVEVDLGDDPERVARFVHVKDTSTERMYYLRVPPTIKRADIGVAWSFGLDVKDYQPVQEA